jgi:hypothetical protein
MSKVLPGFWLVLASLGLCVSILMSEDLPTLLRPMKAYSGMVVCGHCITSGLEITKEAEVIIIMNVEL